MYKERVNLNIEFMKTLQDRIKKRIDWIKK